MDYGPVDYAIRCNLDEIGTLDEVAFTVPVPTISSNIYTITFWFQVTNLAGIQVLANVGNKRASQRGWSVFLHDGQLAFRANFDGNCRQEISTPLSGLGQWHHFAGIVDQNKRVIAAYLDGSGASWLESKFALQIDPGAVDEDRRLLIGGYTDVAGGHFDHTFGRQGTGLIDDFRLYPRALQAAEIASFLKQGNQPSATRHPSLSTPHSPLPTVPVFSNGSEGYACYRIPSIIRATNGDLVAFAEGRVADCSDSTPIIRIVCRRSSDNGHSWGPVQVVARNLLGDNEYGCMNCSPVVDTILGTGRIVVVFNKKEFSEWDIARGKGVNRTFCIFSEDHGRTWHGEKDITLSVHKPYNPNYADIYPAAARPENKEADWRKQVPLPGHAIQLRGAAGKTRTRGRLFFAASYTMGDDSILDATNYAFWSDDLGESWHMSGPVSRREDGSSAKGLNETMAVELENGDVLINSRNYQDGKVAGRRAVARGSFDEGGNIHFQPAYHDPVLVDSGVQATLIRYTRSDEGQYGGKSRILFANPNHPQARINMTVRLSCDEGQTWPVSRVIDPGPAAYSDLLIQGDMKIGLLYERGNQGGIVYTSFTLDWLTCGQDGFHKTGAIHSS